MFRKIIYELHLWLGIITGIILFIVCFTGAMLVFREDIKHLLYPASYRVSVPKDAQRIPVDDLIAKLEKDGKTVSSLSIPAAANKPITVMFSAVSGGGLPPQRAGNANQRAGGVSPLTRGGTLINPYTAEELPKAVTPFLDSFFMTMLQLHRNLMLNYRPEGWGQRMSVGKIVVGAATIIYIVVSITGLLLWLPKFKLWKNWTLWKIGLGIRFRSGFWRFVYDLHNTVGFYTLIPMLILALTGLCWSFSWYRDAASTVLGDQIFKQRMQRPAAVEPPDEWTAMITPFTVSELIQEHNKLVQRRGDYQISIPQNNETALTIASGYSGFFALNVKDKTEWDRNRGIHVNLEKFSDKPLGTKIAALIRPLHFGDVTGTSSKIVFFAACLLAASFPVTGVMLWGRKLYTKHKTVKAR
jgi:uncharacterized iron-regulated membrane protein